MSGRNITISGTFLQGVDIANSLSNTACSASNFSAAEGFETSANGYHSHACGVKSDAVNDRSFVWSGKTAGGTFPTSGDGTYNIYTNTDNISGIYVDGETITECIKHAVDDVYSNDMLKSSNGNVFTKQNTFNSISVSGINNGINTSQSTISTFNGALSANTPQLTDTNMGRVVTVGYVRASMDSAATSSSDNFVHIDTHGAATGSGTIPTYVDGEGTISRFISSVGSDINPIYMDDGKLTALSSTIGDSITPVYLGNDGFQQVNSSIFDLYSIPVITKTFNKIDKIRIAAGQSETYELTAMTWYRLYSDRWCEQGGTVPFQDFDSTAEGTYTCYLTVPYADSSYQLESSLWDSVPSIYNDLWVYTTSKSYEKFKLDIAYFTQYPESYAHIKTYGGSSWYTEGYVSDDTYFHLMNGDTWEHITESWGNQLIYNSEVYGTNTLELTPGKYRIFMVGRGGDYYASYSDYTFYCYTGGAGATLIMDFDIDNNLTIRLDINESLKYCSMKQVNGIEELELVKVGFGGTYGGGTNDITNLSLAPFETYSVLTNKNGDTYTYYSGDQGSLPSGYVVPISKSEFSKIYGTYHGCSPTLVLYPSYVSANVIVERGPGNPLIRLYRRSSSDN